MTLVWFADIACLVGIVAAALCVALLDNLNGSVMALSALGTLLTLLFVVLAAPDVAHSEAVVGAIVLPLLYLMAIGKARTSVGIARDLGEETEESNGSDVPGEAEPRATGATGAGRATRAEQGKTS